MSEPLISIIVPFFNEEDNVESVLREVIQHHADADIIAVDDRSSDGTWQALSRFPQVVRHRMPRHLGQSAALFAGLSLARGTICAVMDGDGQTPAGEISKLLAHIEDADCIVGSRKNREDHWSRSLASRLANWIRNRLLHDGIRDSTGTPKVFKRECIEAILPFDGFHRYLPALFMRSGYSVREIEVEHRRRNRGRSHYGFAGRSFHGLFDLLGMRWWLARRFSREDLGVKKSDLG